jgi:hypothetical protein
MSDWIEYGKDWSTFKNEKLNQPGTAIRGKRLGWHLSEDKDSIEWLGTRDTDGSDSGCGCCSGSISGDAIIDAYRPLES